jgi:putative transposase
MSHTYCKVWIHLVWSTKDREPLLHKGIRQTVFDHIREKACAEGLQIDTIDGTQDHLHCLMSIEPKFSISEVVNKLKGESLHWINAGRLTKTHFAWQDGFAAFSVSESQVQKVRNYILNQEEHHRRSSFSSEVERFLKHHRIESHANEQQPAQSAQNAGFRKSSGSNVSNSLDS